MAASDAKLFPVKNQAYRVTFSLMDADGDTVTGATGLDSEVSKDGGSFADCTSEAIEIATVSGIYYLDLSATEMNADTVAVQVKTTSSGAKTTVLVFYPLEAGDIIVNTVQWAGSATAAGNVALKNTLGKTADITGFNDLSAAQVNTECDTALADVGVTTTVTGRIDAAVSTRATPTQVQTELGTYGALKPTAAGRTLDVTATGEAGIDLDNTTGSLAKGSEITGFNDIAAGAAMTLTSAYDAAKTAATQASVDAVATYVDTEVAAIKAKTDNLPTDPASASTISASFGITNGKIDVVDDYIDTEVAAIKVTTDKLDTALELDGAVYRYTTNALEQAPVGGGAGGDPWLTHLPGSYPAGTAGQILGDNLDVSVSSRAAAAIFSGITLLGQWLGLLAGKQSGNATARVELRATGMGNGSYDETTDSLEAIRNRGDAAWIGGDVPVPPPDADEACLENPARTTGPTTEPPPFARRYGRQIKLRSTPCL